MQASDSLARFCRQGQRQRHSRRTQGPPLRHGHQRVATRNEWPLARTRFTKYYLHANGEKDGTLSVAPPQDEPTTRYIYDPDDPVPTLGGNHSATEIPGIIRAGPVDQRLNENRQDVLVFTSEPLARDLEVTGPVVVKLHAASSTRDTDFIARLIDVYPDGRAFNLTEGILRARFRESIWERPRLLEPDRPYEYTIDLLSDRQCLSEGPPHPRAYHEQQLPHVGPQSEHGQRTGDGRRTQDRPANHLSRQSSSVAHPAARDSRLICFRAL